MPLPRVRLVVLNYNGGELVVRGVEHLERLDWPEDRLEIVVVDNASSDASDIQLESRPRVRLIRSGHNLGFPANNLGLVDLDGVDFVGLVNNDAFVEPGYLHPLVGALEADTGVGAACPKILFAPRFLDVVVSSPTHRVPPDGRDLGVRINGLEVDGDDAWHTAMFGDGCYHPEDGAPGEGMFRWLSGEAHLGVPVDEEESLALARVRLASDRDVKVELDGGRGARPVEVGGAPEWHEVQLVGEPYDVINNVGSVLVNESWGGDRGFLERDCGQYDDPQDVFAWCGAGVLFRPDYLHDVGLFDERFFMYYEDTDMAWRGQARGWRYRYVPNAVMRHMHAATSVEGSPMFQHYTERNRLVMLAKNAPPRHAAGAAGRFLLSTASYAKRDVVRPILRGERPRPNIVTARLKSFGGYLRLLPGVIPDRRRLRSGQRVHDEAIVGWSISR
jgi:GT2 family glycosyltransferase